MFKKLIFIAVVLALSSTKAYSGPSPEITWGRTVDETENKKSIFSWEETPFLSLHLNHEGTVDETWTRPDGTSYQFLITDNDSPDLNSKKKFVLNKLTDWNSRKQTGVWSWFVRTATGKDDRVNGKFTVTPEPIGTTLFLFGAAALAGRKISRSRKQI